MAATLTVETVLQRVKLGVNDAGATALWLTDAQYNTFIANAVVQSDSAHVFQLMGTGLWKLAGAEWGGNPYCLQFANSTAPITAAASTGTYNISCWGSIVTAATDTTAAYSITGCVVDYAAVMSELNFWLAQHRALQLASNTGQDVGSTYAYLIKIAQYWAGISSGGSMYVSTAR